MSGGLTALAETDSGRRKITLALGAASAVIALFALITATRGPAATTSALEDKPAPPAKPVATVSIQADATTPINPTTPISVAVQQGTLRAVTVTDSHSGKSVPGQLASGGTSWQSSGQLTYNDTYQIAVTAVGSDQKTVQRAGTVTTIKPALQAYPSFIPAPGKNSVGVGQPLVVKFDHPVTDRAAAERALHVTASPEQSGNWYWISGSEAHYRPQNYWPAHASVQLTLNTQGVSAGTGLVYDDSLTESWSTGRADLLAVDGATERLTVTSDGTLYGTFPVSLGAAKTPTLLGTKVIMEFDRNERMIGPGYNEIVPYSMRVTNSGEFLHAAAWNVANIGKRSTSNGCTNLLPADAQKLFGYLQIGDPVTYTNVAGPVQPVWDGYGDWNVPWASWLAGGVVSASAA